MFPDPQHGRRSSRFAAAPGVRESTPASPPPRQTPLYAQRRAYSNWMSTVLSPYVGPLHRDDSQSPSRDAIHQATALRATVDP